METVVFKHFIRRGPDILDRSGNNCPGNPTGGITVCGIYDSTANSISVGNAKCSKKDNFSKKLGRTISYGRATNPVASIKSFPKNSEALFSDPKKTRRVVSLLLNKIIEVVKTTDFNVDSLEQSIQTALVRETRDLSREML